MKIQKCKNLIEKYMVMGYMKTGQKFIKIIKLYKVITIQKNYHKKYYKILIFTIFNIIIQYLNV